MSCKDLFLMKVMMSHLEDRSLEEVDRSMQLEGKEKKGSLIKDGKKFEAMQKR